MIKIKNNCGYSDVALLIDKVEFGKMVDNWREEINFVEPIKLKEYWRHPLIMNWESKLRENLLNEKESLETQCYTIKNKKIEIIENKISESLRNFHYFFDEVVNDILKKFNKGEEFRSVVINSLLSCVIEENDYIVREIRLGTKNIKRDRRWYWWNKRLKKYGYKKIAKLTGNNLKTVESAIKSYEKKIKGLK